MANEKKDSLSRDAKLASIALSDLQKAIRFFRLYPQSHPFCSKSVVAAQQRLDRYFTKLGDLTVDVQRDGLYLGEENVLQESGQSTDLSTLLYPEGILGLTIRKTVGREEIGDFLEILSASYVEGAGGEEALDQGTDLMTALWEREFEGIKLHIQDQLAPGLGGGHDSGLSRVQGRISTLMRDFQGEDAKVGSEFEDRAGDKEVEEMVGVIVQRAPPELFADPERSAEFVQTPAGQRRAALLRELDDATLHDPAGRAARVVEWASDAGVTKSMQPRVLTRFRATSALNALEKGSLDQAAELMSQLAGEDATISAEHTEQLGDRKCVRKVSEALSAASTTLGPDALIQLGLRYLTRLDPLAAKAVAEVYSTLENDDVRRVFRRYLSLVASHEAEAIEPITLSEDSRIVKEGVGILAMGGKGTLAWEVLKRLAADEEHELRSTLAQKVVGKVSGTARSEKLLSVVLTDDDPDRRRAAAKELSKIAHPVVYERLVGLVRGKEFSERPNSEVSFVFGALHKSGGARCYAVLQDLATKKSRIFGRKGTERVRSLADNWLANMKADRRRKRR